MIIIIGLGNIGIQYQNTFHNLGFKVIDRLSQMMGIPVDKEKFKSIIGQGSFNGQNIMLVKPATYMNNSGQAAMLVKKKYSDARIIVAVDDIDLPKGKVRYREHGKPGTHNRLRSLVEHIGEDFERVRKGIGRDEGRDLADYVLSNIKPDEQKLFDEAVQNAADTIISKITS
mgnify:FL=1